MSEPLLSILVSAAALVAGLGLWACMVVYVYWDAARRQLPGWQQLLWVIVALFPVVGLLAYLVAAVVLLPRRAVEGDSLGQRLRRVTRLKPRAAARQHPPTLAVADLAQRTVARPVAPRPRAARPAAPEAYTLMVIDGPHLGQEFRLRGLPARIGRVPEAAVCLPADLGVSRQHAEIYRQGKALRLRDLQSAHGTQVNGQAVSDTALAPGDKIQVGHSLLVLVGGGAVQ